MAAVAATSSLLRTDTSGGAAMDMKSAQLAADYSIAVTKKVMDTQELAAQEMLNMLPATPPVVQKGQFIDTYA